MYVCMYAHGHELVRAMATVKNPLNKKKIKHSTPIVMTLVRTMAYTE